MLPTIAAISLAFSGILIDDVNVVDVEAGKVIPHQRVLVRGERIEAIGKPELSSGMRVVDGRGKYLIPGLWDMHVHWYQEQSLGVFTANGVTGARIMFGQPVHLDWRKRIAAGTLTGPQLVVGSPIIDGPNAAWPGSWKVSTAQEGRDAVARLVKEGYDFAKVYSALPKEAYLGIMDESKKRNVPVAGHFPDTTILEATAAGQHCVEHLDRLLAATSTKREEFGKRLAEASDADWPALYWKVRAEAAETHSKTHAATYQKAFKQSGTWHCPTLIVMRQMSRMLDPGMLEDERLRYIPASFRKNWDAKNDFRFKMLKPESFQYMKEAVKGELRVLLGLHRAGVPILAGTDCGNPFTYPGFGLHEELALMVEAGLSPADALRTATLNPAIYLGRRADSGTVGRGKYADLVLLSANPLEKISNSSRVEAVIQRGRLLRRPDLDALLKQAEDANRPD